MVVQASTPNTREAEAKEGNEEVEVVVQAH